MPFVQGGLRPSCFHLYPLRLLGLMLTAPQHVWCTLGAPADAAPATGEQAVHGGGGGGGLRSRPGPAGGPRGAHRGPSHGDGGSPGGGSRAGDAGVGRGSVPLQLSVRLLPTLPAPRKEGPGPPSHLRPGPLWAYWVRVDVGILCIWTQGGWRWRRGWAVHSWHGTQPGCEGVQAGLVG